MKRVLLTGFEPFHNSKLNPSKEVLERIEHPAIIKKEVLPVVFGVASNQLMKLIEGHHPDVVICLGQAAGRSQIDIERVAINIDDAQSADNAGNMPKNRLVIDTGPAAYFSSLPIQEIVSALNSSNVRASISNSAGTFVCNHIFYVMQHNLLNKGVASGFIHLPLVPEQSNEFPNQPTMEIEEMIKGLKVIIDLVAN